MGEFINAISMLIIRTLRAGTTLQSSLESLSSRHSKNSVTPYLLTPHWRILIRPKPNKIITTNIINTMEEEPGNINQREITIRIKKKNNKKKKKKNPPQKKKKKKKKK